MKRILIVTMLSVSASVFANPNSEKSYFIKSFNGQFVCAKADVLALCAEDQKTAFELVENADGFYLKSPEGHFVSALERTDADKGNLGLIGLKQQVQGRETFVFEEKKDVKVAIKSFDVNTYVRANGKKLDQVKAAGGWETFELVPAEQISQIEEEVIAPAVDEPASDKVESVESPYAQKAAELRDQGLVFLKAKWGHLTDALSPWVAPENAPFAVVGAVGSFGAFVVKVVSMFRTAKTATEEAFTTPKKGSGDATTVSMHSSERRRIGKRELNSLK